ncbi:MULTISPECIES: hypothetical protein [unclassified Paenarthrobacter]|uniref:hypothetical protein n=1 Tax=unclassified Paenarthrobacter TaxID=2634190 RepID=UPI001F2B1333|nr:MULTISPECIES: hypothetical protein [unclassified Paenarthrobacter]MCF3140878.1 hypothetical protein [Paenarthrobacter sp. AR 02]
MQTQLVRQTDGIPRGSERITERAQGHPGATLTGPKRRGQEIIDVRGALLPRKFTREPLKTLQQLATLLDGVRREATGKHLRPPAIQHGRKNPFISTEQPNVRIHQPPRDKTRNDTTHNDP